jgi:hypothetical protein
MSSKIRIKVGDIEVEYEGAEDFLKKELPELLKAVSNLQYVPPHLRTPGSGGFSKDDIKLTTSNIAAKLNCKSGPDLVMAACAHLYFVEKKDTFERKTILREMKRATSYYKSSYSNNLSSSLKSLVEDDKLTEPSTNVFSLHANTVKDLHARLAQQQTA